jgi:hypothetical protein
MSCGVLLYCIKSDSTGLERLKLLFTFLSSTVHIGSGNVKFECLLFHPQYARVPKSQVRVEVRGS